MDNLSELKQIWLTAKTDNLPGSTEMMQVIRKYRNKKLVKLCGLSIAAIILIAILVRVVFVYKSTMVTTRIGEGLMIIAGLMLLGTTASSLFRFYRMKDQNNKEFIRFLERTRQRQLFYYKRTQVIALSVCSLGLCFYIFEAVYRDTTYWIAGYSFLLIYIGVLTIIVRPRMFRRQDKKLSEQIQKLEALSKQIE